MKNVILATALMIGFAAHAGTEIGYNDVPLRNKAVFNAADVRGFEIDSVKVTNEAAQIETHVDADCVAAQQYAETSDTSLCETTHTVSKRAVVKVGVSYTKIAPADADAATGYVTLSLPQSSFTADQLANVKAHVRLNVEKFDKVEAVVDQENSPSCTAEDNSQCAPLVYTNGIAHKVRVSVQAK